MDYVHCYGIGFGIIMRYHDVHLGIISPPTETLQQDIISALRDAGIHVDFMAITDDKGEIFTEYIAMHVVHNISNNGNEES